MILNVGSRNLSILLIFISFICCFQNTFTEKGVIGLLDINSMDPTKTLINAANFLTSSNTYEERQAYLEKSKANFKALRKERNESLKEPAEISKKINDKKQILLAQDGADGNNEVLMLKLNEISDVISETEYFWNLLLIQAEDHLNFLENNKDLFDESLFKKKLDDIESQSRVIPDDLFSAENELNIINQKIATTQQKKTAAANELQRSNEEASLDLTKKDESQKKEAGLHGVNGKGGGKKNQERVIEENNSYEFDKILSARRRELVSLKARKASASLDFLGKELEFLKFKAKKLEDIIKRITPKLHATLKDIEEKKILLLKEEQKLVVEKDVLDREIEEKKRQRDAIVRESAQLKSKLKLRKENKDAEEAGSISDFAQEIFILDARILKLRYEQEALDMQMEELVLKKKLNILTRDDAVFQYLRVQEIFLRSNGNYEVGKDFTEILKTIKESVIFELKKQQENIWQSVEDIDQIIVVTSVSRMDLKKRREELLGQKNTVFNGKRAAYQEAQAILDKAEDTIDERTKTANNMRLIIQTLDKQRKDLCGRLEALRKKINELDGVREIWRRAPNAITWQNLVEAFQDTELFVKKWFWGSMNKLNPAYIADNLRQVPLRTYTGFLITLLLFLLMGFALYFGFCALRDFMHRVITTQTSRFENRYALLLLITLNLLTDRFLAIYSWLFIHTLTRTNLTIYYFSFRLINPYYISLFYLLSIIFFFNTSARFLALFQSFNQKLSYFFFSERTTIKNTLLLSCLFYSTSLIFPFWLAVASYDSYFKSSILSTVLLEGYKLLTFIIIVLFFDKEDIISLIPRYGYLTWILRKTVEHFFYPIFLFFISIFVILSPCLGYTNLGWFLFWMVPFSVLIILGGYFATDLNRTYTQQIFLSESDLESEVVEKFEHARVLYGIYVVVSFLCIWLAVWAALAYLWTNDFKLVFLWKTISETWTIPYGDKDYFGLVQLFIICAFIFSGYFAALVVEQFILKKIFEIFKIDAGLENTISKIFQYITFFISVLLALVTLNLIDVIKYFVTALLFGVGFGMRDQLADIFAGILILLERQIEKDHYIEFNEDKTNYRGTVHKMSIRSTTIRTVRNFFVSIPNKLLISRPVINWGAGRAAIGMEFELKVAFGPDPELICHIIKQIIYDNPSIMRVPAALVRLDAFSEYGMVFFARAFIHARRVREQWDIAANIRLEILKAFKAQNIALAYPTTLVRFADKEGLPPDLDPCKVRLDNDDLPPEQLNNEEKKP